MTTATNVEIHREIQAPPEPNGWVLCFHEATWHFPHHTEHGYRFMWRYPWGDLQPARGQARLPSLARIQWFLDEARRQGWGDVDTAMIVVEAAE